MPKKEETKATSDYILANSLHAGLVENVLDYPNWITGWLATFLGARWLAMPSTRMQKHRPQAGSYKRTSITGRLGDLQPQLVRKERQPDRRVAHALAERRADAVTGVHAGQQHDRLARVGGVLQRGGELA